MTTASNSRKIVIVGAGAVGSTAAYALTQAGIADTIVLLDTNESQAQGQVLDLAHGAPFVAPVAIRVGTPEDYTEADLIIITAGIGQQPGQSRRDLLARNAEIITGIMNDIVWHESEACVLIVSNPVDALTQIAVEHSGWPPSRVFGSGTVLDTARLRYLLARHCELDPRNVHAYVIGEHGDSEVVAWSLTHVGGVPLTEFCSACGSCEDWEKTKLEVARQVRESAYHIIDHKGATWFAIGLAIVRIATAVLRHEQSVLTVSTLLQGEFGLHDVCLGVPAVIGKKGVERIIDAQLPKEELLQLQRSAAVITRQRRTIEQENTTTPSTDEDSAFAVR